LALHISEQENEIDALSQELSTSAFTSGDPCATSNGDCVSCISSTGGIFGTGCYWAYQNIIGSTIEQAGLGLSQSCLSKAPSGFPFNTPTNALTLSNGASCSLTLQSNPSTETACQDAATGVLFNPPKPAKCKGQQGFLNPTTGCPGNTPFCCPEDPDCMIFGDSCDGTCVADSSYCARSSNGECVPNNIGR
jgi:hypothetical protein